ncbi:MAG: hypothetical protein LDLANPLL_01925 [Turneriella sp.]|mgnify:CR=1 FL=1|nr:hypothetical protein [Turneriella sp.]
MKKTLLQAALVLGLMPVSVWATDVANQDSKSYVIKVQGEGNLSISEHTVSPNGTLYGLCGYSFCSFEIPGSKINADKGDRITIRNGNLTK